MKSFNPLEALLFADSPVFAQLEIYFKTIGFKLILPFFLIGVIWEFFHSCDFLSLMKRLLASVLLIGFFTTAHKQAKEVSFDIGAIILQKYSTKKSLARGWHKSLSYKKSFPKLNSKNGSPLTTMFKLWANDGLLSVLWFMNMLCIQLIRCFYSIVFHFTYIFTPILCLISLTPVSKDAIFVPIKALMWCFLVPIIAATILVVISAIISVGNVKSGFLAYDLESYVALMIFSIMLLGSGFIAKSFINGMGIEEWSARTSTNAGKSILNTGLRVLKGNFITRAITSGAGSVLKKQVVAPLKSGVNNWISPKTPEAHAKALPKEDTPNLKFMSDLKKAHDKARTQNKRGL